MIKIAEFHIEDVFEITGKGIVLAGRIVDGVISIGNQVEFDLNGKWRTGLIIGIEGIRHKNPDRINTGLIIKPTNGIEITELEKSKGLLSTVNVLSKKITLSELIKWLATKTIEEKIVFNELLLSDLTTMNRAICSDDNTSDKLKIDTLKWSNELSNRIWNMIFDLKRNEDNQSENKLGEHINFYAKQSEELAGYLVSTTNSTINRFYHQIEKQ